MPIYEPGLDVLVERHRAAGRLTFTTDLAAAIDGAEAVFIAVGTPSRRGDGHADLTYVFAAAEEIAARAQAPDPGRDQVDRAGRHRPQAAEDLRHAAAGPDDRRRLQPGVPARGLGDRGLPAARPGRVRGRERPCPRGACSRCYRPLNLIETPILFTTLETAELIKYATNAFLATKITFINEVADLCERVGADVQQVAKGMGLDGRIGKKFLHAGPGYGGSCFPKDTLALLRTGEQHNTHLRIVEAVVGVNEGRKRRMVAQDHRGLRRLGRRQDDRDPGRDLQAGHRRHAREPVSGDRAGAAGRGGRRPRLRPRGHGARPQAAAGRRLVPGRLPCAGGRRRRGDPDRVERVPRPRSRPGARGDARAAC